MKKKLLITTLIIFPFFGICQNNKASQTNNIDSLVIEIHKEIIEIKKNLFTKDDFEKFKKIEDPKKKELKAKIKLLVNDSVRMNKNIDSLERELNKYKKSEQELNNKINSLEITTKDLTAKTAASGTIVVLINQLYMGAGVMPGTMAKTASGGNAMNYFTHMRLWINKINGAAGQVTKKDAEGKDVVIGGKSKVLVMKTRYGQPGVTGEFKIMFTDDETTNPVDEFLYKAKAKGFEYVKEVRKKFIYTNIDTGEVIESKDAYEFCKLLMTQPAPEKRTRNDNSTTAFEFICGRLKVIGKPLTDLVEAISKGPSSEDIDIDDDDDDGGIAFDIAAKEMLD
jgi:RecA/RadA recombinase